MPQSYRKRNRRRRNHPDTAAWKTTFAYKLGLPCCELSALRRAFFLKITDGSRDDLERIIVGERLVKNIGPVGIATLREHLARHDALQNGG